MSCVDRPGVFAVLTRRDPLLLWIGQLLSAAGDRLYGAALLWVAAKLTDSASAVAVVYAADTAPFLLASTVSGLVSDRRDGLRVARTTDLLRAAVVATLPALYFVGWLNLVTLAAAAALLSGLEAFFLPALQASLPRLVARNELTPMVSLLDSTDRLGRVLGPGLIGILGALPVIHLYTIDAGTFVVSAMTLTLIVRRPSVARQQYAGSGAKAQAPSGSHPLLDGWRATFRHSSLRHALILRAVCNIAWPAFTVAAPLLVARRYDHGIGGYGLVLASFGVGNLVGTVLAARIRAPHLVRFGDLAWLGAGIGFLALALAPNFAMFLAAAGAAGVCTPLANVPVNALIATLVPANLLARAYTAQRTIVVAAGLGGLPIAAALVSHAGEPSALIAAGSTMITAAVIAMLSA